MNDEKYFQIKVTAKAPQGYRPRTMSLTGLGVSNKANAQKLLEAEAIKRYKEALTAANPDVEFKYSAVSTSMNPKFVIVDNEEPAEAKKNKKKVAPAEIDREATDEKSE